MKIYSQLKLPTLLAASLSCLMLAGCGTDDKPRIIVDNTDNVGGNNNGGGDNNNGGGDSQIGNLAITVIPMDSYITKYEDGTYETDKFGNDFCKSDEDYKCGLLSYAITADMDKLLKVPTDNPVTVNYELTSENGDIADILKNPTDKSGIIKLDKDHIQQTLSIALKTDNKATGNWTVTLKLTNPTNGATLDKVNTKLLTTTIIDPQSNNNNLAKVNDTGVTFTGNNLKGNTVKTDCNSTTASKQDCNVGRDAEYPPTPANNANGWAGFDFTKLDANGDNLDNNATDWSCVRDNVTGLVWERKTFAPRIKGKFGAEANADKDYRDAKWDYAYYDSQTGLGSTTKEPNGTGNTDCKLGDDVKCNTQNYIAKVNQEQLCGIGNWRIPTRNELFGIVNLSSKKDNVAMQANWFFSNSDNIPLSFWTSSVAIKNDYHDGYRQPKSYKFNNLWTMYSSGSFDRNKPAGYGTSAILAVSDSQ